MVRERILEIFRACRRDKDAPFEEADFLHFLDPSGRPRDTFAGQARRVRFMHAIEMEFAICFPLDAWNRKWSLGEFATYVEARAKKPDVNLKMARKSSLLWNFPLFQILFVPAVLSYIIVRAPVPLNWIAGMLAVAINGFFLYAWLLDGLHAEAVIKRIRQRAASANPSAGTQATG